MTREQVITQAIIDFPWTTQGLPQVNLEMLEEGWREALTNYIANSLDDYYEPGRYFVLTPGDRVEIVNDESATVRYHVRIVEP